jgi:hypothetical protein
MNAKTVAVIGTGIPAIYEAERALTDERQAHVDYQR